MKWCGWTFSTPDTGRFGWISKFFSILLEQYSRATEPTRSRHSGASPVPPSQPSTIQRKRKDTMIRVGVIGYGYWGPNIVRNFFSIDGFQVHAVCDKNPESL